MKTAVKTALPLLAGLLIFCGVGSFIGTARAANVPSSGLLPGVIGGYAYGGSLQEQAGGSNAAVAPLSLASLGCTLSTKTVTASAVSMQLRSYATSGPVVDSATTSRTTGSATVQASSSVQNVNILGGLITAVRANAVAKSAATATGASGIGTANLVGLKIAGVPILLNPAPNTIIPLRGLGSVTLNEQSAPASGANFTSIGVTAIDIKVTLQNTLGLPIGTQIVIASAMTSYARTSMLASLAADAYGLYAAGGAGLGVISSGPWALAATGCIGGSSQISVTNVSAPGEGRTGTVTDTASGSISAAGANAQSSSTVRQMNVLSGMITATIVTSTAQASSGGTASATSRLYNAKVAGILLSNNPRPNTKIPIAGLGFVIVNEQSVTVTSSLVLAQVNAFDLHVTVANSYGLPVGADIIVGHSDAVVSVA